MTRRIGERYAELKDAALLTMSEFYGKERAAQQVCFEKTRIFPYPLMRHMIAETMYREGYPLVGIAPVMGCRHPCLSIGIKKLLDIKNATFVCDKESQGLIKMFYENVGNIKPSTPEGKASGVPDKTRTTDRMKVRIKKLSGNAVIPAKAHSTDAGFDLTATSRTYDEYGNVCYGTGLAFEIPEGFVGYLFPRSSNSKKDLVLSNCVGVIDAGYRGEVTFKFKAAKRCDNVASGSIYATGDRVGQLIIMPIPDIEFEEAEELTETDRGIGGYGSSGR